MHKCSGCIQKLKFSMYSEARINRVELFQGLSTSFILHDLQPRPQAHDKSAH